MKWYRVNALLIRYLYLYKRSFPRLMDIFFWPILELLLWGFISLYLQASDLGGFNILTALLGAIILWDLLSQAQRSISITFLEELWERNFLNIFVTPLRVGEFIGSGILLGILRVAIVAVTMSVLAIIFYSFNIFTLGFALIPFVASLLIFGWILGLFTTGLILRYGSSAQVLAFGFIAVIQPFSAVFYPVSSLPESLQLVSYMIPSTHIFEGMRTVIATGTLPLASLGWSFLLNAVYLVLVIWYFYGMFAWVKRRGLLAKLDF